MNTDHKPIDETLVRCFALASRLEGEGYYNIAKLLRAAADVITRGAASRLTLPSSKGDLVQEIEQMTASLAALGVDGDLLEALQRGRQAMTAGRLPLFSETPHAYVCRTCGTVSLGVPEDDCPNCLAHPATFQPFLPVYWLDALEPFAALDRLRQTPVLLAGMLEGLPEMVLNRPAPDGGWSVYTTLTHLRDAQGLLSFRIDLMLEKDDPSLESMAVFEWARRDETNPPATGEVLQTYQASRNQMVARLQERPLSDWWRTGRHEEFGPVTIRQQASYFAMHELTHLPQIRRLCKR